MEASNVTQRRPGIFRSLTDQMGNEHWESWPVAILANKTTRGSRTGRILHIKHGVFGWRSNPKSLFAKTFQSFLSFLYRRLSIMRAFLLAPIAFIVAGMQPLQICHAKGVPDWPLTAVSAGHLEQRSPFHAISSTLVARAQVIDPDIIPAEVNQKIRATVRY